MCGTLVDASAPPGRFFGLPAAAQVQAVPARYLRPRGAHVAGDAPRCSVWSQLIAFVRSPTLARTPGKDSNSKRRVMNLRIEVVSYTVLST